MNENGNYNQHPDQQYSNQQYQNPQYQNPQYQNQQYQNPQYQNQYAAQRPAYSPIYQQQPVKTTSGAATAALICGILALFVNPMYIISLVAIITGFVGISAKPENKSSAIGGLILGFVSLFIQLIADIIITIFSFGFGFFSFFI